MRMQRYRNVELEIVAWLVWLKFVSIVSRLLTSGSHLEARAFTSAPPLLFAKVDPDLQRRVRV
eukprot:SAG11_NODE_3269_length_2567_cov_2.102917_2_plen_63_part_00